MKKREHMQAEYIRLNNLVCRLESMREAENSFGISVETPELDDVIRRVYKKISKLDRRLGIRAEEPGIPWFMFCEMIRTEIGRYFPAKYRGFQVYIKEREINGEKMDMFWLEKGGVKNMPVLSLKEYADEIGNGADEWRILKKVAADYKEMVEKGCPGRRRQMER